MRHVLLLTALVTLAAGCGGGVGNAKVTGNVGPWDLSVNGTVFAVHDKTQVAFDNGARTLISSERAPARVRIHLTEARFDPAEDLRFLSAEEKLRIWDDVSQGAWITISFEDAAQAAASMGHSGELYGNPQNPNGVRIDIESFGLSRVAEDDTYPAKSLPPGSAATWSLDIGESSFAPGGKITGTLKLTFAAANFDPADAYTGEVTIEFTAEVVAEKVAECNEVDFLDVISDEPQACEP